MRYKALRKDTLREIWRTKTRFLSIFAIILLGVAFFAGLSATGPVMVNTADNYYADQQLADAHIFSTMGLDDEDVAILDSVEGAETQYHYRSDVVFTETGLSSRVFSYSPGESESMNELVIVEGRLPESSGEIALDHTSSYLDEYTIGDTIEIDVETLDDFNENFTETSFEVVGFFNHPKYIERSERGNTQVGTGTLNGLSVILEDDFDMDILTDAFVRFPGAHDYEAYSDDYEAYVNDYVADIEESLAHRPAERYNELYEEIETEINDGYQEIEDARQELADAQDELAEARQTIEEGYAELEDAQAELDNEESQARNQLENQRNELNQALSEINATREQLEAAPVQDPALLNQLYAQEQEVSAGLEKIQAAEVELTNNIQAAQAEINEGLSELEEATAELEEGEAEFLEESETAEEEIREAEEELADAEEQLADLEEPEYFIEDRNDFSGYAEFQDNAERINNISRIFPVFFFLLAALISLTTMTRMVDEGRNQIGTMKALGYGNVAIAMKYFVYAMIATFAGGVLGLFLGYWLFPNVIIDAYSSMYNLPSADIEFYWSYAIISMAGALLATGLSTLVSVRLSLRSNAATLLRPKAPKKGKRIVLERIPFLWNRFTFTQKVASRNLFRYKRRMLMTLFGVAGGTALLLTGFGLSDSISDLGRIQFEELFLYDAIVSENTSASEAQTNELEDTLANVDGLEDQLRVRMENGEAFAENGSQDLNIVVPSDTTGVEDFIVFRDVDDSNTILELPTEGALITDKLADLLDVSVGDTIQVETNDGIEFEVELTDIVEHYVQHYIYLSPEAYENSVGEEVELNSRFLQYDTAVVDDDELGATLTDQAAVQGVVFLTSVEDAFQDSMDSLDVVTVVLIVSAASLAFVVLYNLTNINVSERIRELSTIKVLGFFDREVTMYVYRENFVLTIMGILIGFVLGFIMHLFVLQTAEVDILRFSRDINATSYLYSFLLMFLFSSLVMVVMHFKLKRVDMVEALKTQD